MEGWNEAATPDIENPLSAPQKKEKKSLQDSLTEELDRLQLSPANLGCIHRVPCRLRDVRPEAYTPRVVSIGPLHHGKEALKAMEEHKMKYLKFFLRRSKESVGLDLMHYIKKVQGEEERLRSCYSETIKLKSDEFVKIILVDAIFLIEFLFRNRYRDESDESDCLFNEPYMSNTVWLDLLMLENQLPFFILKLLFYPNIFPGPISFTNPADGLLFLSHAFLDDRGIYIGEEEEEEEEELKSETIEYCSTVKVEHLVDQLRMFYITPKVKKGYVAPVREPEATTRPIAECGYSILQPQEAGATAQSTPASRNKQRHKGAEAKPTPSIQKLRQAGVKFKASSGSNLFDIQFDNGVLEIPKLKIQDSTEVIIRNLVAYEQCHHQSHNYVSDYVCMMDYLVDTTKDAELLVEHEIVQNRLGGGKQLSTLINSMATEVGIHPTTFSYGRLCAALKDYYNSRWHKMIADLRQNYFNTPWAAISVIAAGFLLILTVILTICAIVSL